MASLLAVPPQSSHHVVDIGDDGLITQVTPMRDLRQWENGGYFVLRPEIFDYLHEGEDLVEDALMRGWSRSGRVLAYPYKGYWSPADTVKERVQLEEMYHRGNCPWMIWDPERSGRPTGRALLTAAGSRRASRRRTVTTCCPSLSAPSGRPLSVLALGAHPDDIEIGAGGTLLTLAESQPSCGPLRGAHRDGRSPGGGAERGRGLLARRGSEHQPARPARRPVACRLGAGEGHPGGDGASPARRTSSSLRHPTSPSGPPDDRRDRADGLPRPLYLAYEIPKWDGDSPGRRCTFRCPPDIARRKVEFLHECFPSQRSRDWWDDEVFLGLARLRGMECRAPYAEAFTCTKSVIDCLPLRPVAISPE